MTINLPKPLWAMLLVTVAFSAIALLQPESIDEHSLNLRSHPSVMGEHRLLASEATETTPLWIRQPQPSSIIINPPIKHQVVIARKPVVLPPVQPQRPTAPTPQFTYLGRIIKDNQLSIFLEASAGPIVVKLGDVIDGDWRVDKITSNSIDLYYLPLHETRQLAIQ
ncbi:hypothetical protein [Aquirhabdus sp.]|uniref:hypothetical protein n=1 Tax=Aquirhabdus sp. TaxID=2824160 RepID=UPI00396C946D